MALHLNPAAHDADPPASWTVQKCGRKWNLLSSKGGVLDTFETKAKAEAGKTSGFIFNLYEKEGRWFKGENIPTWKPYAACKANMDAAAQS